VDQVLDHLHDEGTQPQPVDGAGDVELLVEDPQRLDALAHRREFLTRLVGLGLPGSHAQEARDDGELVLDPVLQLLEQVLVGLERLLEAVGLVQPVDDRAEDGGIGAQELMSSWSNSRGVRLSTWRRP
jgi:hypothetical protein